MRAVEQGDAEQIGNRSEQSKEQITQSSGERLRAAIDTNEGYRSKGEQLQRDVEVEQITAYKNDGQRGPDRLKHDPKGQRAPAFADAVRRGEFRACVKRGGRDDHC